MCFSKGGSIMRKIKAYLTPDQTGCDLEVEFEVTDSASDDEVERLAWEELCDKVDWYWEEVNEE